MSGEDQAQAAETEGAEGAAETTEQKAPKRGVGTVAMEAIRDGKTNEEALAAVKAEFPDANTSMASINWYRNNLRSGGEDVPTARALGAAQRDAKKAEKKAAKEAEKVAAKAQREREKAAKKQTTTDSTAAMAAAEGGEQAVDPLS